MESERIDTEFTDFQRFFINLLSYCQVSLSTVEKGGDGEYHLVKAGWLRTTIYVLLASNTVFKFIYLLLLVLGHFGPIDFLDKMSALLWILMCFEILQELLFYVNTYPLFEVLASLWKVENKIYNKLGRPRQLTTKSRAIHRYTLILHTGILVIGCILIGGQFLSAPHYAVYTYSAFKTDNALMLTLFTCHEVGFMWQAWTGYLSIVTLSTVNAVELTFILDGMRDTMLNLEPQLPFQMKVIKKSNEFPVTVKKRTVWEIELGDINKVSKASKEAKSSTTKIMPTKSIYTIESLLDDYKQLSLNVSLLNSFCSYRIVGVHTIGYAQFISDVFMMIQLMRLTDHDIPTVMWYGEDATACLYMIFRMFSLMSKVTTSSESFMRGFRHFLGYETPTRKRLTKVSKTLRLVSLKIGSNPVCPKTVGAAVSLLLNYYLCVIVWK